MVGQEADVISHLLDVERNASAILAQASEDAEKRIAAARAQADQQFKAQYDDLIARLERHYAEQTTAITNSYTVAVSAYKEKIGAAAKDVPAFNALLDALLFKR